MSNWDSLHGLLLDVGAEWTPALTSSLLAHLDQAKLLADVFLKCLAQQVEASKANEDTANKESVNIGDNDENGVEGEYDDGNYGNDEYQEWGHVANSTTATALPENSATAKALANTLIQVWTNIRVNTAIGGGSGGGGQLLRGVSVDAASLPLDLRYRSLLQPLRFGFGVFIL
jgi:hypothetical protein